jgi:hypothetical protein
LVLLVLDLPKRPPKRELATPRAPPTKAPGTPPTVEPAAAPAPAEPRAVHLFKRKGAPPKAAVLLIIKSDNIDKNYLKISNKRD